MLLPGRARRPGDFPGFIPCPVPLPPFSSFRSYRKLNATGSGNIHPRGGMPKSRADDGTIKSGRRKQDVQAGCPGSPASLSLIRQLSDDGASFEHILAVRSLFQASSQVGAGLMNDEVLPPLPEEIAGYVVHLPLVRKEGGRARLAIAAGQLLSGESPHPIRPGER